MAKSPDITSYAHDINLYKQAEKAALEGDVSSPRDGAVFFGSGQKREALQFCKENERTNICMTEALRSFDEIALFRQSNLPYNDVYDIGDVISERFAMAASGNVTLFAGSQSKETSTFRRVEICALMLNENVTSFTCARYIDKELITEDKSKRDLLHLVPEHRRTEIEAALEKQEEKQAPGSTGDPAQKTSSSPAFDLSP